MLKMIFRGSFCFLTEVLLKQAYTLLKGILYKFFLCLLRGLVAINRLWQVGTVNLFVVVWLLGLVWVGVRCVA